MLLSSKLINRKHNKKGPLFYLIEDVTMIGLHFPSISVYFSNKWNTIFIFLIYHDILIQERATLTYFVHLFLYLCCNQTFFHYISKDGLEYKFPVQMKNIVSNVHVKSEHNQTTDFLTIFSWNSSCSTNSSSFIYNLLIIHSTSICCLY